MAYSDYSWVIKELLVDRRRITSCTFKDSYQKYDWCMSMVPSHGDNVCVMLQLVSEKPPNLRAHVGFSLLNTECQEIKRFRTKVAHNFAHEYVFDCPSFVKWSKIFDAQGRLLHGDHLVLECTIDLVDIAGNVCLKPMISTPTAEESLLSDDFRRLFDSGMFSDVTLNVQDRKFQAHKAILAARSPVFAAMFKHKMEESKTNRVVITDMEPDVVHEMLRFIYTNNLPNLERDVAKGLLVAADKYALVPLIQKCEYVLYQDISIETAAENFLLADRYNLNSLKGRVIDYINQNAAEVIKTEGWKHITKTHAHLIVDLYETLVMQI